MKTILLIVALTVAGSFLCSLFEAALYSVTPTRIEWLRRKKRWGARKLAQLRGRVDEPIAAILTVNTFTHTMGATWTGALVGEIYGNVWVTWFSVAFTLVILFLTEIVPKTVGVVHANTLAAYTAWPIQLMIWLVWPFAWVSLQVTQRLTGKRKAAGPSEEEVLITADLALQAGKLLPKEKDLIANSLRLNDVKAGALMTPRTVVEFLPAALTVKEGVARAEQLVHSRLPLVEGSDFDQVAGVVHRRDVFDAGARGEGDKPLRELARPVGSFPDGASGSELLEHFLRQRQHLAIVVSEHGYARGIVTLEDVLEYLLGEEIVDEFDRDADLQATARRRAAKRLSGQAFEKKERP